MLSSASSSSLPPNETRSLMLAEGRWSGWEKRTGDTSLRGENEARGIWAGVSSLSTGRWEPLPCCFSSQVPGRKKTGGREWRDRSLKRKRCASAERRDWCSRSENNQSQRARHLHGISPGRKHTRCDRHRRAGETCRGLLSVAESALTTKVGTSTRGPPIAPCDPVPWYAWQPVEAGRSVGMHKGGGWASRGPCPSNNKLGSESCLWRRKGLLLPCQRSSRSSEPPAVCLRTAPPNLCWRRLSWQLSWCGPTPWPRPSSSTVGSSRGSGLLHRPDSQG